MAYISVAYICGGNTSVGPRMDIKGASGNYRDDSSLLIYNTASKNPILAGDRNIQGNYSLIGGKDFLNKIQNGAMTDLWATLGLASGKSVTCIKYCETDAKLFIGTDTGEVYSYDGTSFADESATMAVGFSSDERINVILFQDANYIVAGGKASTPILNVNGIDQTAEITPEVQDEIISGDISTTDDKAIFGVNSGAIRLFYWDISSAHPIDLTSASGLAGKVPYAITWCPTIDKFMIGGTNIYLRTCDDAGASWATLTAKMGATSTIYTIADLTTEGYVLIGGSNGELNKYDGTNMCAMNPLLKGLVGIHIRHIFDYPAFEQPGIKLKTTLYNKTNVFKEYVETKIDDMFWSHFRYGGNGVAYLMLKERLASTSELNNIDEGWNVLVQIIGDTGDWENIYRGICCKSSREKILEEEVVTITCVGYMYELRRIWIAATYTNKTVKEIAELIMTTVAASSHITYDACQIEGAFTIDTITFDHNAYDALNILALIQGATEWGVNAQRKFYFKAQSTVVDYVEIVEKDLEFAEKNTDDCGRIVNKIYFVGGATMANPEYTKTVENGDSQTTYGLREVKIRCSAITTDTVAEQYCQSFLTADKDITSRGMYVKDIVTNKHNWIGLHAPIKKTRLNIGAETEDYNINDAMYIWGGGKLTLKIGVGKIGKDDITIAAYMRAMVNDINRTIDQMRSIMSITPGGIPITKHFNPTEGQTVFNLDTSYTLGDNSLWIEKNGLYQRINDDYTETSPTSFTMTSGCVVTDKLTAIVIRNLMIGIATNTTNFNKILSSADDTVQKALDTIDDHGHLDDILLPEGIFTDHITVNKETINSCDSLDYWTVADDDDMQLSDIHVEGIKGISLSKIGTFFDYTWLMNEFTPTDLTNKYVDVLLYIADSVTLAKLVKTRIIITDSGSGSYYTDFLVSSLTIGWNILRLDYKNATIYLSPDISDIKYINLEFYTVDNSDVWAHDKIVIDYVVSSDMIELQSNKENAIINTSVVKYPTVNLLKTGLDTKFEIFTIDQSQLLSDNLIVLRTTSSNVKRSQSFKAGSYQKLTAVDLKLIRTGSPTGNMWLELYASDINGLPTGGILAQSENLNVSTIALTETVYRFTFTFPYTVINGIKYCIVMNADYAISGSNYISIALQADNVYADGIWGTYDGAIWSSGGYDYDFYFITYFGISVVESNLSFSDITDKDATTDKHGLLSKLDKIKLDTIDDSVKYYDVMLAVNQDVNGSSDYTFSIPLVSSDFTHGILTYRNEDNAAYTTMDARRRWCAIHFGLALNNGWGEAFQYSVVPIYSYFVYLHHPKAYSYVDDAKLTTTQYGIGDWFYIKSCRINGANIDIVVTNTRTTVASFYGKFMARVWKMPVGT